jgi:hypothetical protein
VNTEAKIFCAEWKKSITMNKICKTKPIYREFFDMIFIKKGLRAEGAETQLGKKLIWPPHKIFPLHNARGVICVAALMLFADIPPQHY